MDLPDSGQVSKLQLQRQASKIQGSTLTCHDLSYKVDIKKGCGKATEKDILKNINALFVPGMNAILGPTGSGKSSLLDTLAGRKNPVGLSGQLLVDGHEQPKNFKCMTGYVVQDDVVMGTLTIRENFMFSANLRLSKDISNKEKEERVNDIISELGLVHVAESKVGTEFIRGVSGGERKRTNIGMELIISPSVLFLDEPTTGLDSSTANAVMLLLHQLARKGRTIVFSIHQPRYSIYKLFDRLTLLALGETVFHGPSEDALEYFSNIGYECEAHNNPPDFFLDVINGDSSAVQNKNNESLKIIEETRFSDPPEHRFISDSKTMNGSSGHIVAHSDSNGITQVDVVQSNGKVYPTNGDVEMYAEAEQEDGNLAHKLHLTYCKSKWYKETNGELTPILGEYQRRLDAGEETRLAKGEYVTNFLTQFSLVSRRTVLNIIRNPQTSTMQVGIMIIFALIVGIIYFDLNDLDDGIQNRVGAFFFIVMNQVFGNLSSVELFIKERAIFIHENVSGFYRVSAYYLAKVFCDVIPMRIVPVSVFSLICYFMVGLEAEVGKFFIFLLTLALTGLSAASVGFAISATVRVYAIANLLIALCFVFMMVFSGLLINLGSIAEWLRWIQYISIFRYGLNALSINELKDKSFCFTTMNGTRCDPEAGNTYLTRQGIPYETAWDLWLNELALFLIALLFLILTYVQLRRINKLK